MQNTRLRSITKNIRIGSTFFNLPQCFLAFKIQGRISFFCFQLSTLNLASWFKKSILICVIILCSACSTGKHGRSQLKEFCEKDAGITVYKTVEAEGYYDDSTKCPACWRKLMNTPIKYIEYCDFESWRHPISYALSEHGCFRLTKVVRASGQCHVEIDKSIAKRVTKPFTSFKKDYCIKVEKIDKSQKGVGYFMNEEILIEKDDFDLYRYEYSIRSLENNQLYGKLVNYSLIVKLVGGAQHGCSDPFVTGKPYKWSGMGMYGTFISKVIKFK